MSEPMNVSPEYGAGEEVAGFVVRRSEHIPELRATAVHAVHRATGAGVVHLHVDDDENLFSATFATPSGNSTGVAHILEHCVLAGSERYPVRDAFNELSRSSLATFLNAFTAPDFTSYPACSRVPEDFYNLASVYTDVVFHPRLTRDTFRQEAHHRRVRDDGTLEASGVVFNEMKGSLSSAERIAESVTLQRLMPDTCYGHESGGRPEDILALDYDAFRAFHRTCYTAENAHIFLYGNRPLAELLAFLGPRLDRAPRGTPPAADRIQPRWPAPREAREVFPADATTSLARRSIVNVAWLTTRLERHEERLALEVLDRVLVGSAGAPLRRALVDSGLGEDLSPLSGVVSWYPELPFAVGLRGTDVEHAEEIETLVLDTLADCIERGLDPDLVDAAFQEHELAHRELRRTGYPYPVLLMRRSMVSWVRGHDPIEPLRVTDALAALRERWRREPALFADIIRRHLLGNTHRLRMVVVPDPGAADAREARIRERLAAERRAMTDTDIERVRREAEALLVAQRTKDSPEARATLPQLRLEQIPRDVLTVPTRERRNGVSHLEHAIHANGIVYAALAFDVSHVPERLQPYVALLGEALAGMGAAGLDYRRMATRTARVTGGVEAVVSAWEREDGAVEQRLLVRSKALARNGAAMVDVLRDIVSAGDLEDAERLASVLIARRNRLRALLAPQGHIFSWRLAASGLSLAHRRDELWQGGLHLRLLNRLTEVMRAEPGPLRDALREVRDAVLTRARVITSAGGDAADIGALGPALDRAVAALPAGADAPLATGEPLANGARRIAVALPGDVCYVSRVIPVPRRDHPLAAALHVLAHYLRANVLYQKIRVEGGAYGGLAHYDEASGHLVFMSYRDPNLERTLEVYDTCLDALASHPPDEETVRRTIIGALGRYERPLSAEQKCQKALRWHLGGPGEDERRRHKAALLAVDAKSLHRAAEEIVRPALAKACEAVYAPRDRLEAANAQRQPPFEILTLDA